MTSAGTGPWYNLETLNVQIFPTGEFEAEAAYSRPKLSRRQRLVGFFGCGVLACLSTLMTLYYLYHIRNRVSYKGIILWTFFYSAGLVLYVLGTGFVSEFKPQFVLVKKPIRATAISGFLFTISLYLISVFIIGRRERIPMVFLSAFLQALAYFVYGLSYIPDTMAFLSKLVGVGGGM